MQHSDPSDKRTRLSTKLPAHKLFVTKTVVEFIDEPNQAAQALKRGKQVKREDGLFAFPAIDGHGYGVSGCGRVTHYFSSPFDAIAALLAD